MFLDIPNLSTEWTNTKSTIFKYNIIYTTVIYTESICLITAFTSYWNPHAQLLLTLRSDQGKWEGYKVPLLEESQFPITKLTYVSNAS